MAQRAASFLEMIMLPPMAKDAVCLLIMQMMMAMMIVAESALP